MDPLTGDGGCLGAPFALVTCGEDSGMNDAASPNGEKDAKVDLATDEKDAKVDLATDEKDATVDAQPETHLVSGSGLEIRPHDKIDVLGDSISASANLWWDADLQEYALVRYGADAPTWQTRALGGIGIRYAITNLLPKVIADAPNVVIIELITNEFGATLVNSTIEADATELILKLHAALPGVRIAWIGNWSPHSELWDDGTSPNFAEWGRAETALRKACVATGTPYIDIHTAQQADERRYNGPSPGTTPAQQPDTTYLPEGNNTVDGTHPNWRGSILMARAVRSQITFVGTTYPDLPADWLPNADETPLRWLRASTIPGPAGTVISTWADEGSIAHDYTATGSARPTLVDYATIDPRIFNGQKAVRFDGVDDALTSVGTDISGAKTVFAVYKLRALRPSFGTWSSLLTLKGTYFSELIPDYSSGTVNAGRFAFMNDMKPDASDGAFNITSTFLSYPNQVWQLALHQTRISATFTGGSSTDQASYDWQANSRVMDSAKAPGFFGRTATDPCSIGGRVSSTGVVTNAAPIDVGEVLVFSGVMPALHRARINQYLARKLGP